MQNNHANIRRILRMSLMLLFCLGVAMGQEAKADSNVKSTRPERRAILEGNKLYGEGKFAEASLQYRKALQEQPQSDVARFNLGLSCIRMSEKKEKQDSVGAKLKSEGIANLTEIAALGKKKPDLSSKANYNLGNLKFQEEDYAGAISFYKQALRLNPNFNDARRNLRIAQLRQQNQQDQNKDDKNKDQNKDQQDQDKDKQDQNQDQNQDKQDQNQDQQEQNEKQNPAENELSKQAAQQILNAVENNEARTRAKIGNEQGKEAHGAAGNLRKW